MFEPVPEGVTKVIIRCKVWEADPLFMQDYGTSGRRGGLMVPVIKRVRFEHWQGFIVLCSCVRNSTLGVALAIHRYKLSGEPDSVLEVGVGGGLLWTSISSSSNTPGRFMQLKLG